MTPPHRPPPSTAVVVVALLIVYLVWGSTYLAMAVMIETMPPLLSLGLRYTIAASLMFAGLMAHRRLRPEASAIERPTAGQWRSALIIGTLLLLGGNGGVILSEQFIPSGIAAVLIATVPIFLAVFDSLLTRRRPSGLVIGGLVAGMVGVGVLLVPVEGVGNLSAVGIGLAVAASISWAIGSLYTRSADLPRSGLLGTGMEMLCGGIVLFLAGALLGEVGRTDIGAFSARSLFAIAYLIVFGSLIAFTAYTWLLAHVPVSTVGTYAYVNPIVAVALGAVILQEPITARTLIASALIIGAVVAMVSGRPRAAEETGPAPEAASLAQE